ncbi:YjfA family protein [Sphaerisporangium corydalis]|uniref:YjfA family protein n=1 Tax=Sphaerisporangium corydalis TaxID=1441875 RepID=A0ABV9ED56_9ACTN|nr:YjfA family protein [Sphaerisporangium corydalis]
MRIWQSLLALALVPAICVLGLTTPAAASATAAPCGPVCDGQDPNTFHNCASGAINVLNPVAGLQLRYSPACQTTWGKFSGDCSCQVDYFEIQSYYNKTGGALRASSRDRAPTNSSATVMLDDYHLYNQVCISYSNDDGATHQVRCTGRY